MRDLMKIARLCDQYKKEAVKGTSLKGAYCKFIMFICNNEGLTQDEIASSMQIDKSSAARQLSSMESDGYIERRIKKEDKRNLLIYPTEKARLAYPFVRSLIREWNEYVLEDLTEDEKELLNALVLKMKERAENWHEHKFTLPQIPKELKE